MKKIILKLFPLLIFTEIGIVLFAGAYFFNSQFVIEYLGEDVLEQIFLLAVSDIIMGSALFFMMGFFVRRPVFKFLPARILFASLWLAYFGLSLTVLDPIYVVALVFLLLEKIGFYVYSGEDNEQKDIDDHFSMIWAIVFAFIVIAFYGAYKNNLPQEGTTQTEVWGIIYFVFSVIFKNKWSKSLIFKTGKVTHKKFDDLIRRMTSK